MDRAPIAAGAASSCSSFTPMHGSRCRELLTQSAPELASNHAPSSLAHQPRRDHLKTSGPFDRRHGRSRTARTYPRSTVVCGMGCLDPRFASNHRATSEGETCARRDVPGCHRRKKRKSGTMAYLPSNASSTSKTLSADWNAPMSLERLRASERISPVTGKQ